MTGWTLKPGKRRRDRPSIHQIQAKRVFGEMNVFDAFTGLNMINTHATPPSSGVHFDLMDYFSLILLTSHRNPAHNSSIFRLNAAIKAVENRSPFSIPRSSFRNPVSFVAARKLTNIML